MSLASFAFANVAASQTDSLLISGATNRIILVMGVVFDCIGAPTDIQFNSKGSGAGTAISANFSMAQNIGLALPVSEWGWFQTNSGESLTCTTSAGSTTGIQIVFRMLANPGTSS